MKIQQGLAWKLVYQMQNLCHGITDLEGEASLSCVTRALGVCSKDLCSVSRAAHQDKQCWCFLTGQLAQTKKRSVSGVHLLLAPILFLERSTCARQEWEGFSPVSCLPLLPNKNRLPHPCSYQTWQRTYNLKKIKTVPLEKKKQLPSTNKLHHVPKSYWFTLLHYLFSFE